MKIDVQYTQDLGVEYTVMMDDQGVVREADGRIKLWYTPF